MTNNASMTRLRLLAAVLAAAVVGTLAAATGATASGTTPAAGVVTQASIVKLDVPFRTGTYPVFDAAGKWIRNQSWRLTPAGGNCCEVYITATPSGRLVEFGGTYPIYSDDRGRTWYRVTPETPLVNGEGAVVAAPNGDIDAIGWDPYSGDHLQGFHYDAGSKSWLVSEVPLHSPFYDRPWITVARGPFVVDGKSYPYITVVRGGYPAKDPELLSTDGLTYSQLTSPAIDELTTTPASGAVRVAERSIADFWQPHPGAGTVPLTGGGLLQMTQPNDGDSAECPLSQLNRSDTRWQCFRLPGGPVSGAVRQDSRGWLHEVSVARNGKTFGYRMSTDGGRTWTAATTLVPPGGGVVDGASGGNPLFDVKANGKLGVAVVSTRVDRPDGTQQDMVFRVDTATGTPVLRETMYVGKGDLGSIIGVGGASGDRFDFASVALLPDGKVAMSFDDSTTRNPTTTKPNGHSPELAVQQ